MEVPWNTFITWKSHGSPMNESPIGFPWDSHACPMEVSWGSKDSQRSPMEVPGKSRGNSMEVPWTYRGSTMNGLWNSCESLLRGPWGYHGGIASRNSRESPTGGQWEHLGFSTNPMGFPRKHKGIPWKSLESLMGVSWKSHGGQWGNHGRTININPVGLPWGAMEIPYGTSTALPCDFRHTPMGLL